MKHLNWAGYQCCSGWTWGYACATKAGSKESCCICKLSINTARKKVMAVLWACERFHLYLLGLYCKALEAIYGPRSDALQVHSALSTFRPEASWLPLSFNKDTRITLWWCNQRVLGGPCGHGGITKTQCESKGCCFDNTIAGIAWCFYRKVTSPESWSVVHENETASTK